MNAQFRNEMSDLQHFKFMTVDNLKQLNMTMKEYNIRIENLHTDLDKNKKTVQKFEDINVNFQDKFDKMDGKILKQTGYFEAKHTRLKGEFSKYLTRMVLLEANIGEAMSKVAF